MCFKRNSKFTKLQQLLIKPTTTRVAGQSPATGFILFVVDLKANCCKLKFASSMIMQGYFILEKDYKRD